VIMVRSAPSKLTAKSLSSAEVAPDPPEKKFSSFSVAPAVEIAQVTLEKSAPVRVAPRKAFRFAPHGEISSTAPEKFAFVRSLKRKN